jgi:HEAT repeat protein
LLGLVDAPEIEIRRSVIHVLAEIGPDPDVALSPVIEVFRQRGADVEGVWLVPLFASLGVAAVPPLVQFVGQDHDPRLRENACRALGAIGPPAASAVPALLRALEGAIPRVRFSAAFALGEIGDPSVVPALIERLHHDENRTVRMYAASALGNIDARFEETVPALLRTLEVDDDIVAAHAVAALELVGDRAIPWLRDALSAESERLRGYAARVAGALGPAADPLIPLLVDRLGVDPSDDVARRAATALRELESQAHERLVEAARSPDPRVRGYAVLILGEARSTAADSVRLLTAALEDPDLQVCRLAAWSLGSIGPQDPDVVSALIARLGSEDVELRRTAAWALGNIGPAAAAAEEPLTTRLEDGDPTVRVEAAEALDKIHGTYRYGS